MDARALRRRPDPFRVVEGVQIAESDVLRRRHVVRHVVLERRPYPRTQPGRVDVPQVDAVPEDRAVRRVVEPAQQLHQGGLARTVQPHERQRLPVPQTEADPAQHPRVLVGVPEPHVPELDALPQRRQRGGVGGDRQIRRAVDEVQVVLEQHQRLVGARDVPRDGGERALYARHRRDEDRDVAHREVTGPRRHDGPHHSAAGDQRGEQRQPRLDERVPPVQQRPGGVGRTPVGEHPALEEGTDAEQSYLLGGFDRRQQLAVEDLAPFRGPEVPVQAGPLPGQDQFGDERGHAGRQHQHGHGGAEDEEGAQEAGDRDRGLGQSQDPVDHLAGADGARLLRQPQPVEEGGALEPLQAHEPVDGGEQPVLCQQTDGALQLRAQVLVRVRGHRGHHPDAGEAGRQADERGRRGTAVRQAVQGELGQPGRRHGERTRRERQQHMAGEDRRGRPCRQGDRRRRVPWEAGEARPAGRLPRPAGDLLPPSRAAHTERGPGHAVRLVGRLSATSLSTTTSRPSISRSARRTLG